MHVPARLRTRPRGHRVEAPRQALQLGTLPRAAERAVADRRGADRLGDNRHRGSEGGGGGEARSGPSRSRWNAEPTERVAQEARRHEPRPGDARETRARRFPRVASCRISLSSVRSAIALRSRVFSVSRSFSRLTWSLLSPPNSWRQREYVTSVTPIERTASATLCPCDTSTSTWRSFATISSGLCLFLGIVVLLGSKAIPQGGPLQRGRITSATSIGLIPRHTAMLSRQWLTSGDPEQHCKDRQSSAASALSISARFRSRPATYLSLSASSTKPRRAKQSARAQSSSATRSRLSTQSSRA